MSYPDFDPVHEARIRAWAEGWDACRTWMQPQLDRANRDADLWYMRANHTPAEIRDMQQRRMDAAASEYWEAFLQEVAA